MTVDFAMFVSEVELLNFCLFEIWTLVWVSTAINTPRGAQNPTCKQTNPFFQTKVPYRVKKFSSCALCSEMSLFLKYFILICPFHSIAYDIEKSSKNKGFITWLIVALMRSLFI